MTNVLSSNHLLGYLDSELERVFQLANLCENPKLRSEHVLREFFSWATGKSHILNISKRFVPELEKHVSLAMPFELKRFQVSRIDGTAKFLLASTADGALIETVLIPERNRLTQCISSQVGCRMACNFCQTGKSGFKRNLTAAEIVGQVVQAEKLRRTLPELAHLSPNTFEKISNVVFMGMGEPLDNLQEVLKGVSILTSKEGLLLSHNKVTVSTVGVLPQLSELLASTKCGVALSLHSPFQEERNSIIPISKAYPLQDILAVMRKASALSEKTFLVQYALISGLNDTELHAQEIIKIFQGIRYKINLIPINESEGSNYHRPNTAKVYAFQQTLKNHGAVATIRISKGLDIDAACGQLVNNSKDIFHGAH